MNARDALNTFLDGIGIYARDCWEKEPSKPENIITVGKGQPVPPGYHPWNADDVAEGLMRNTNPKHPFYTGPKH